MQPHLQRARLAEVQPGDEVLVSRILRGDSDAFRVLYRRHARYVAGVIVRICGDDTELDDIMQDTFVRVAQRLDSLRDPSRVRPWLVTIAVRMTTERLERRRRRGRLQRAVAPHHPQMSDPRQQARADELYAALDQLPPKFRVPWMLNRVEGQALDDVAVACDVSLATVKRRIAEAQIRLDRRLGGGR